MEKREAAEFLGVSIRTLDRFAKAGRLSKGRAKKKTRPVVVFDRTQLEKLKEELVETRPSEVFRRLNTAKPKEAIGFRLDPYYLGLLSQKGQEHNLSAAEYARKLVVQGLEDTRVAEFRDEVKGLRTALGHTFYALLVMKFDMSEREAEEFVASTIERA